MHTNFPVSGFSQPSGLRSSPEPGAGAGSGRRAAHRGLDEGLLSTRPPGQTGSDAVALRTTLTRSLPPRREELVLSYDRPLGDDTKFRFRTTSDPSRLPPETNIEGLSELRMSGSASLSRTEHMEQIKKAAGDAPAIVVFDLREESHAIVGGYPVTWFALNGWSNVGLSRADVLEDEGTRIMGLREDLNAGHGIVLTDQDDWKRLKRGEEGRAPSTVEVTKKSLQTRGEQERPIQSEAELVEAAGCRYVRITATDNVRPTDEQTDAFIEEVRKLPEKAALHFHCKAGMGRTTTFMAMYDMLRNARDVGLHDIVKRQTELGDGFGKRQESLTLYYQERDDFIQEFHAYAKENPGGKPMNWSEWLKRPRAAGGSA